MDEDALLLYKVLLQTEMRCFEHDHLRCLDESAVFGRHLATHFSTDKIVDSDLR